jgi:hypothetical protein
LVEQVLYEQLKERKARGESIDLYSLSRDELRQLWHVEGVFEELIAKLCDVTYREVKSRRYKLNIKEHVCRSEDIRTEEEKIVRLKTVYPATDKVLTIKKKILNLTDDEIESLIDELMLVNQRLRVMELCYIKILAIKNVDSAY